MAKRGVLEHPKTLDLAARLDIMEPWALGLLEALWQWTAKYHPTGDLTGTKPRLFAASIRYRGDADELWGSLLDCGFIDQLDGRLLVHDWSEHADDTVRKMLLRRGEKFADGSEPYGRKYGHRSENVATPARSNTDKTETKSGEVEDESCLPLPLPLPEPLPIPDKNPSASPSAPPALALQASLPEKTARQVRTPDPRFTPFREEIERSYELWNNGLRSPWDGAESKQLNELLKSSPGLTLEDFRVALRNRGASDGEVLSRRPRVWLGSIADFLHSPLDRYNRPIAAPRPLDGLKPTQRSTPDELLQRADELFSADQVEPSLEQLIAEAIRLGGEGVTDAQRADIRSAAVTRASMREAYLSRERAEGQRRYREAVRVCFNVGRVSASEIRRKCKVDYAYAAAWINQMAEDGIVESVPGGGLRLLSPPEWMTEPVAAHSSQREPEVVAC